METANRRATLQKMSAIPRYAKGGEVTEPSIGGFIKDRFQAAKAALTPTPKVVKTIQSRQSRMDEAINGPAEIAAPIAAADTPKELRFAEGGMVPSVPYEQSQQYLDGVKRAEADKAKLAAIEAAKNPVPVAPVAPVAAAPTTAATQLASVPSAATQPALAKPITAPPIQKPVISSAPTPTTYAGVIRNGNSFSDSASSSSPSLGVQSSAQNTSAVDGIYGKTNQFATGGHINGPGTATSDSIPILASKGEFIINAAAAKKIGKSALNALNNIASATDEAHTQGHFATGSDDVLKAKDALEEVATKPKLNLPSGITQNGNTFTQSPVTPAATQGREIPRQAPTAQQQMSQVETVRPNQPVQVETTKPMPKVSNLPSGVTQVNANTFEQSAPSNPGREIPRQAPAPSAPMQQVNTTPPPAPEASPRFQNAGTAASDAKMAATRSANAARVAPPAVVNPTATPSKLAVRSEMVGNAAGNVVRKTGGAAAGLAKFTAATAPLAGFGDYKLAGEDTSASGVVGNALRGEGGKAWEGLRNGAVEAGLDSISGIAKTGDFVAGLVGANPQLAQKFDSKVRGDLGDAVSTGYMKQPAQAALATTPVVKPQAPVAAAAAPIAEPTVQVAGNPVQGGPTQDELVATKIAAMNKTGDLQKQVNEAGANLVHANDPAPGVTSFTGTSREQDLRNTADLASKYVSKGDKNRILQSQQLQLAKDNNVNPQAAALKLAQLRSADTRYGADSLSRSHADANKTAQARLANEQAGTQIDIKGKQSIQALREKFINAKPEERAKAEEDYRIASGHPEQSRFTVVPGAKNIDGTQDVSTVLDKDGNLVQMKKPIQAPLQAHIDALKSNPKDAAAFDAKFGAGSAAKILGK